MIDARGFTHRKACTVAHEHSLTCPLVPGRLGHATTSLDGAAIRAPSGLKALVSVREPYLPRLKQSPKSGGTPLPASPGRRLPNAGPRYPPATPEIGRARRLRATGA